MTLKWKLLSVVIRQILQNDKLAEPIESLDLIEFGETPINFFFILQTGVHDLFIKSLESESIMKIGNWTDPNGLKFYKSDNLWKFHRFYNKTFDIVTLPVSVFSFKDLIGISKITLLKKCYV